MKARCTYSVQALAKVLAVAAIDQMAKQRSPIDSTVHCRAFIVVKQDFSRFSPRQCNSEETYEISAFPKLLLVGLKSIPVLPPGSKPGTKYEQKKQALIALPPVFF